MKGGGFAWIAAYSLFNCSQESGPPFCKFIRNHTRLTAVREAMLMWSIDDEWHGEQVQSLGCGEGRRKKVR